MMLNFLGADARIAALCDDSGQFIAFVDARRTDDHGCVAAVAANNFAPLGLLGGADPAGGVSSAPSPLPAGDISQRASGLPDSRTEQQRGAA